MTSKEFLSMCEGAVLAGDKDEAARLASECLARGHDILAAIEGGFAVGVRAAGERWERGEYFLPELAFAAEAMKAAMAVLQPELLAVGAGRRRGRIVIGTVQGDIHDIGKSLVATMLLAHNYEVIDLGADVTHERFADAVAEHGPDCACMSALLTTTMAGQRHVIERLGERGLRDAVKVVVGGAPTTAEWARDIGADGHGDNAVAAVHTIDALVGRI
jgi:corrinoid protein of di/trimethylamine methyltransferase